MRKSRRQSDGFGSSCLSILFHMCSRNRVKETFYSLCRLWNIGASF